MSEESNSTIARLKSLIYANTKISSNYNSSRNLLISILESVKTILDCDSASILLVNDVDGSLTFDYVLGPKGAEVKKIKIEKDSIAGWVAEHKKPQIINNVVCDPRFNPLVQNSTSYITKNMMACPVIIQEKCFAVIEVLNKKDNQDFTEQDLDILELMSMQSSVAYKNLHEYTSKVDQINLLQKDMSEGKDFHYFVAKSQVILDIVKVIETVAVTNSSVLIIGESGVGKELFAEQIHIHSDRKNKPFIRLSCAALSPTLLESELFGHVKGAFTDAVSNNKGRFELADGGTIFLDEIGELPLDLQVKLLRVIQERKFERVGSSETISVDVRIIAATNRNLEKMVEEGTFRSDLYFRLNVVPLNIPPLRERKEDLEALSIFFLNKYQKESNKVFQGFSDEALNVIKSYYWPGNVRELENVVERACILGNPPFINVKDLYLPVKTISQEKEEHHIVSETLLNSTLELKDAINEFKKEYITKILIKTNWNQTEAAKILGIQRTYVSRLLNELNIKKV